MQGAAETRRLVVVAWMGFIVFGMSKSIAGPLLPYMRQDLGLSLAVAGTLFTADFIGFILSVLIGGAASDVWGKRVYVLTGAGLLGLGLATVALARSVWYLRLGFFMMGLGSGGFDAGLSPLIGDVEAENRGYALNLLHMFFGVGALMSPVLARLFGAGSGAWRGGFSVSAALALGFLVMFAACRIPACGYWRGKEAAAAGSVASADPGPAVPTPEPAAPAPKPSGHAPLSVERAPQSIGRTQQSIRYTLLAMLKSGPLLLLAALMTLYVGLESGVSGWMYTFMIDLEKFSPGAAAAIVSLFWVALTLGRLVVAHLSGRLGYERTILTCASGALLAGLAAAFLPNGFVVGVAFVALGLFFSGIFPTTMAQGTAMFPHSTGSVAGLFMTAGSAGGMLIPWLIGAVSGAFGLSAGIALIPLGCALIAGLAFVNAAAIRPVR